jgi:phosphatidylglycerol:prolipoprotein diacylglycerol transferase
MSFPSSALLPYFEQPVWRFGPIAIHAFGVAVAAAFWVGMSMGPRRFETLGLRAQTGQKLGVWVITGGIAGAHLFSLLLYFPAKLRTDPLAVFRIWEDISSVGGMLGGVIGAIAFFLVRADDDDRRQALAYIDAIAFVFPVSLAIGRMGCALAHDHPGTVTSFPLAVSLSTARAREYIAGVYDTANIAIPRVTTASGFHDLGVYEFLFLAIVVVPLFAFWNRRRRPAGFYLAAFAALYFPVRFGLDMLRVADARYVGLTPAQWLSALVLTVLPLVALRQRRTRFALSGAVILATAWACRG